MSRQNCRSLPNMLSQVADRRMPTTTLTSPEWERVGYLSYPLSQICSDIFCKHQAGGRLIGYLYLRENYRVGFN